MDSNLANALRLMLVTDDRYLPPDQLIASVRAAVQGGVTCVQLRLKEATARDVVALARALRDGLDVPLLVNDRPDIAMAVGAAGVHLGEDDVTPTLARRAWPEAPLIGASVGTPAELGFGEDADYWGIGPWRTTPTKARAGEGIGRPGFERIVAASGGRPCLAIGGIMPEDIDAIRAAGGWGVAVVSGILGADDVATAARRYAQALAIG